MRSRLLLLCLGILLNTAPIYSQMYFCGPMQATWKWNWDNSQYELRDNSSGNITGLYLNPFCPGYTFPITGTITSGSFTFSITGLTQCQSQAATSVTFTGLLGQPGCAYAHGNWNDSLGHAGAFGESQAYPNSTANIFTTAVDVPTSESSQQSGSWNPTLGGAPWHQTLAPNSPAGEFSGRLVYEYIGGSGTDSCWFQGSIFKHPFDSISKPGFFWDVNGRNLWGADFIGWTLKAVQYYRAQNRVPCGARFPQQMVVDAAYSPNNPTNYGPYTDDNGVNFYGVPYDLNTLGGDITATTVTSVRNSQVATNTTWK